MPCCVHACTASLGNITSNQLKIRELHINPIVSRRTSGTTFAVILFERRQRLFFFLSGIVILEGHLPPQRQTSLNSSGRQTVAGRHSDMSSRPPSTIVWLKLAIKIFRQSQFIQTEIKEKDFTFKSLVYRCLTLNVWRVCWLHLWSQSCSPSPPSCPDLLSKRFKGDGIFSISHHVLWKDFALIAKNWTGLEVWFCFCCCWTESLNFNLGRNTCRWRLTAVISWL